MLKIDVLDERENLFLKRKDLMLLVDHAGSATPKTNDLIVKLSEKFKVDQEKIEIVYILSQKGTAKSKIKAKFWQEKVIKKEKPKEEKGEGTTVEGGANEA